MLSFLKTLMCCHSLESEWRSGPWLGRSAICRRLGTCLESVHLLTMKAVQMRLPSLPMIIGEPEDFKRYRDRHLDRKRGACFP